MLDEAAFKDAFDRLIFQGHFNEEPSYYPRYRTRYYQILKQFAVLASDRPCDVLDVGGGQLAVLAKALWNDRCTVSDIGGQHLEYIANLGIRAVRWNLCTDDQPLSNEFDVVFFSEVIEHLLDLVTQRSEAVH